jgi:hypothetical protein
MTAIGAAAVPVEPDAWDWELVTGHFYPRIKAGTIWLMTASLVLARWYRVPVHPFRASVLASFVSYLGFAATLSWMTDSSPAMAAHFAVLNAMDGIAFVVMATYWAFLAWRPESAHAVAYRETTRLLATAMPEIKGSA